MKKMTSQIIHISIEISTSQILKLSIKKVKQYLHRIKHEFKVNDTRIRIFKVVRDFKYKNIKLRSKTYDQIKLKKTRQQLLIISMFSKYLQKPINSYSLAHRLQISIPQKLEESINSIQKMTEVAFPSMPSSNPLNNPSIMRLQRRKAELLEQNQAEKMQQEQNKKRMSDFMNETNQALQFLAQKQKLAAQITKLQEEKRIKKEQQEKAAGIVNDKMAAQAQITGKHSYKTQSQASIASAQEKADVARIVEIIEDQSQLQTMNSFLNIPNPQIRWSLISLQGIQSLLNKFPKAFNFVYQAISGMFGKICSIFQIFVNKIKECISWMSEKFVAMRDKIVAAAKGLFNYLCQLVASPLN